MSTLQSLSIFFPCFNEEKNIVGLIEETLVVAKRVARKYEVIVVDDGSQDATAENVRQLAAANPEVKLVQHAQNKGYGASLRTGFEVSQYEWIFFTDGDKQFDVAQLEDLVAQTDSFDVVIGYRESRADGPMRSLNAFLFGAFIDVLFRLHVRDIDCAFKLMKASVVKHIDFISTGAMISTELLYRLKKQGVAFYQLPVRHFPRLHGTQTGNSPTVVFLAFYEAFALYVNMKFGWNWR